MGINDGQFPLDLFAATLFTFDWRILLAHGTDGFEFLPARFANIFIDGHGKYLFQKNFEADSTPNAFSCPLSLF
jgi:hypothetical protein